MLGKLLKKHQSANNKTKLDDFNQAVDWENSSFCQSNNQSSSVIS